MDKQLITEKIDSLIRCIKRVIDKRPDTADQLIADVDLQDIITLNLSRAVQLAVDIAVHIISEGETAVPSTMAESFDVLATKGIITHKVANRMKMAVGFRNTTVHNYQDIDWQIVFNICHKNIDDFKDYIKEIDKII